MSMTISIRVEDDIKKEIEDFGYSPGEFLKKVLLSELKRERSRRSLSWLAANRLAPGKKPAADMIRDDRERNGRLGEDRDSG